MSPRREAFRIRRTREVARGCPPGPHAFLVRGRLVTAHGSAPCRCTTPTGATCTEPCRVCRGVGPHETEIRDGAIRCTRCTYSRQLARAGEREGRTW